MNKPERVSRLMPDTTTLHWQPMTNCPCEADTPYLLRVNGSPLIAAWQGGEWMRRQSGTWIGIGPIAPDRWWGDPRTTTRRSPPES